MIFKHLPQDWRELQKRVWQVLSESGFKSELGRQVKLSGRSVTLDVYAVDLSCEPASLLICDCQHWRKQVSPAFVENFGKVVEEAEGKVGFIISAADFPYRAVNKKLEGGAYNVGRVPKTL